MTAACIGEPVSWLRLEQLALGELPAASARDVDTHLAACAACRACLDQIRADQIALPALPALPPPVPWWRRRITWGIVGGLAAAAAALLLWLRLPGDKVVDDHAGSAIADVKGAGRVVVDLVRERGGATLLHPTTFRAGDRFKLIVTCSIAVDVWADIVVYQPEGPGGAMSASYPAQPMRLPCGNRVPVPGAFTISGPGPAWACLALDVDHPPTREPLGRRKGFACLTLLAEP